MQVSMCKIVVVGHGNRGKQSRAAWTLQQSSNKMILQEMQANEVESHLIS